MTTPLLFIHEYAISIRALAVALVVYEPKPEADEEYDGGVGQKFVPISELLSVFDAMKRNLGPSEEIGISSEFITCDGRPCHFVFGDMAPKASRPGTGLAVSSSPDGWHFYEQRTVSSFAHLQAQLMMERGIDLGWVAAGLRNGFNILRLTAKSASRFPFEPHFVAPETAQPKLLSSSTEMTNAILEISNQGERR